MSVFLAPIRLIQQSGGKEKGHFLPRPGDFFFFVLEPQVLKSSTIKWIPEVGVDEGVRSQTKTPSWQVVWTGVEQF